MMESGFWLSCETPLRVQGLNWTDSWGNAFPFKYNRKLLILHFSAYTSLVVKKKKIFSDYLPVSCPDPYIQCTSMHVYHCLKCKTSICQKFCSDNPVYHYFVLRLLTTVTCITKCWSAAVQWMKNLIKSQYKWLTQLQCIIIISNCNDKLKHLSW